MSTELGDVSISTHSVLAARESTLVPEAGKRKRGRPRKVADTDGTELAAPRLLGRNASNEAVGQKNDSEPVSLLLACNYKRYLY